MNPPAIFQVEVHVGVRASSAGGTDVIGMICSYSEGPAATIPCAMGSRKRQGHGVGEEQVGLPEHKHSRVQVDLKFVDRRIVAKCGRDGGDGALEFGVVRFQVEGGNGQIGISSVPRRGRVRKRKNLHRHWAR